MEARIIMADNIMVYSGCNRYYILKPLYSYINHCMINEVNGPKIMVGLTMHFFHVHI